MLNYIKSFLFYRGYYCSIYYNLELAFVLCLVSVLSKLNLVLVILILLILY